MRIGFSPSGLGDSLPLRFVGGVQRHCVIRWAVSTLITKAFIAYGVVLWFVQHRWAIDSRVSLTEIGVSLVVTRYFPSRVLMTRLSCLHATHCGELCELVFLLDISLFFCVCCCGAPSAE